MPNVSDYIEFTNASPTAAAYIENTATNKDIEIRSRRDIDLVCNTGGGDSDAELVFKPGDTTVATFSSTTIRVDNVQLGGPDSTSAKVTSNDGKDVVVEATSTDLTVAANDRLDLVIQPRSEDDRDAQLLIQRNGVDLFKMAALTGIVTISTDMAVRGTLDASAHGVAVETVTSDPSGSAASGRLKVRTTGTPAVWIHYSGTWRSVGLTSP